MRSSTAPRALAAGTLLYLGILVPASVDAQTREVCIGSRVERGWIVVDAKWNPTRCGDTSGTEDNVWVIERYSDHPAGHTMDVCASQNTPSGWETISSRWNPTRCESVQGTQHNVRTIRRIDDDAALARVLLDVLLGDDSDRGDRRRLTGVYSDMGRVEENGDVIGTEIFLLYSTDGSEGRYHALVQFAEGVPEPPQLVEVDVRGTRIEFVAYYAGYRMEFTGEVDGYRLEGEFAGPIGEIDLPRRDSFWQ